MTRQEFDLIVTLEEARKLTKLRADMQEYRDNFRAVIEAREKLEMPLPVSDIKNWGVFYVSYGYKNVDDIKMFKLIKEVVGPLEQTEKKPVRGSRTKVQVTLTPKNKVFNSFRFTYIHTLTKNEKCKVKTVVSKSRQIVCSSS